MMARSGQAYFSTTCSKSLPALARSSGIITGWHSMLALKASIHGSAIAGI